jgi:preprotein translocase subunit YajC
MDLGFPDILLIIVVIGVFYYMLRQRSARKSSLKAAQAARIKRPTQAEIQESLQRERKKKTRQLRLRIVSGALIVTGAAILLEVTGVLKYVTLGYAMSGTLIICGAGVLLLSVRR